jgi:hypothetical protein
LENYLQKLAKEQSRQQQKVALASSATIQGSEEIPTCNSTEKLLFYNKTLKLFRYSCQMAQVSFQKWCLFSQFVTQSHQLEQHFSVAPKQMKVVQPCTGGGAKGGNRRLAAMAAVFVLRWLEQKCTEWNVEETQRELLERLLVEEQQNIANEIAAATKANNKKKKKKKAAAEAKTSSSKASNEYHNEGDSNNSATTAEKNLKHEPPGSTATAQPFKAILLQRQQHNFCGEASSAASPTCKSSNFPVAEEPVFNGLKLYDPKTADDEFKVVTNGKLHNAEVQSSHHLCEAEWMVNLKNHQSLPSPNAQGVADVDKSSPASNGNSPLLDADDVIVDNNNKTSTCSLQDNKIFENSNTAVPTFSAEDKAVTGKFVKNGNFSPSTTRLFDATSVQILLENRMKTILTQGLGDEAIPSTLVYL